MVSTCSVIWTTEVDVSVTKDVETTVSREVEVLMAVVVSESISVDVEVWTSVRVSVTLITFPGTVRVESAFRAVDVIVLVTVLVDGLTRQLQALDRRGFGKLASCLGRLGW